MRMSCVDRRACAERIASPHSRCVAMTRTTRSLLVLLALTAALSSCGVFAKKVKQLKEGDVIDDEWVDKYLDDTSRANLSSVVLAANEGLRAERMLDEVETPEEVFADYRDPYVSVVLPLNGTRTWFVVNALRLLGKQSFRRWEAIIIDEGGTTEELSKLTLGEVYTDKHGEERVRHGNKHRRNYCVGDLFEREALLLDGQVTAGQREKHDMQNQMTFDKKLQRVLPDLEYHVLMRGVHGRIKYLCVEGRLTSGVKRSLGAMLATADYVTFWAEEELYAPHRVGTQFDFIVSHEYDMVTLAFDYILDARTTPIHLFQTTAPLNATAAPVDKDTLPVPLVHTEHWSVANRLTESALATYEYPNYGSLMFRRDLVTEKNLFFLNADDGEIFRFALHAHNRHGATFAVVPRALAHSCFVSHRGATWREFDVDSAVSAGALNQLGGRRISWPTWITNNTDVLVQRILDTYGAVWEVTNSPTLTPTPLPTRQPVVAPTPTPVHVEYCARLRVDEALKVGKIGLTLPNEIRVYASTVESGTARAGFRLGTRQLAHSNESVVSMEFEEFDSANEESWRDFAGIALRFTERAYVFNWHVGELRRDARNQRAAASVLAFDVDRQVTVLAKTVWHQPHTSLEVKTGVGFYEQSVSELVRSDVLPHGVVELAAVSRVLDKIRKRKSSTDVYDEDEVTASFVIPEPITSMLSIVGMVNTPEGPFQEKYSDDLKEKAMEHTIVLRDSHLLVCKDDPKFDASRQFQ